ncbi:MAG TPA: ATP-binding protein, partial [Blastocatellia bacterium]|nr:ATP-binding protein [Blastocatellia bacterium]
PAKLLSYEAILADLGENLIKAESAREALEYLLKHEVAVVLMDVSMPELDGFELAEIIHQHPRYQKTAIIFVSGVHLSDLDRLKAYERGAVDYVSVPVVPEILRAKVGVFVELYRKTRQLEQMNHELERRVAERTMELQRRNDQLQKLNDELTRSNRELDAFTYIASHDLKEPLRGIHNYSHFLFEDYADKLDAQGRDQLLTLKRLTQRMELLIDALLRYSRLGRQELERQPTELQSVLDEALESLISRIQEGNVEVRLPRRLPALAVDRTLAIELLVNLIANAIKYNNKPKKWVEIGWKGGDGDWEMGDEEKGEGENRGQSSNGDSAQPPTPIFYVRDNGIGISERHQEAIFRIFKRLHGRDDYGGGTGVGLTIVRKIVERHGGRIWLESVPGEGTTFYFTLTGEEAPYADQQRAVANSAD